MQQKTDIEGFVLAGGGSRRFGTDKARALVEGTPLVMRNAAILGERYGAVRIVSAPERSYDDLGLETIYDLTPDHGPLAGLQAALRNANTARIAIAACDLVGLRSSWYAALERVDALAVAFRDERWHPLVALYHRDLLPEVERRLADGRRAVRDLLDAHGVAVTPPEDFAELRSIDSPELLP